MPAGAPRAAGGGGRGERASWVLAKSGAVITAEAAAQTPVSVRHPAASAAKRLSAAGLGLGTVSGDGREQAAAAGRVRLTGRLGLPQARWMHGGVWGYAGGVLGVRVKHLIPALREPRGAGCHYGAAAAETPRPVIIEYSAGHVLAVSRW